MNGGPGGAGGGAPGQSQRFPATPSLATDFDGDGITDSSDECVEIPRGTDNNGDGCPDRPPKLSDTDDDGIPNDSDACPTAAADTADGCPPDTTAPRVKRVVPAENATGIAPATNVSAFFSEAMMVGSINTNTIKLFKTGTTTPIAVVVSYDAERKKAVLNPKANLQRGAKYKTVVTTGTKDLAGNRLDQNAARSGNQLKQWFFTVRN